MDVQRQQKGFNKSKQMIERWDDNLKWVKLDNSWKSFRFVCPDDKPGFIGYVAVHWVTTNSGKRFPIYCKNFDPKTETWKRNGCVICKDFDWNKADEGTPEGKKIKNFKPRIMVMTWAINRDKQEIGNAKNDKNWTPFDPTRFPQSLIRDITKMADAYTEYIEVDGLKKKISYDVTDEKFGRDVLINYDSKAKSPSEYYSVQLTDKKPLTDEELHYMKKLPVIADMVQYMPEEEQISSLTNNGYYGPVSVAKANDAAGVNEEDADVSYKKSGFSAGPQTNFDDVGAPPQSAAPAPATPAVAQAPAQAVAQAAAQTFAQDPSLKPAEPLAAPTVVGDAILAFAGKHQLGSKVWQKGELTNKTVPNCFGEYQGKTYCRSECPVRKTCIDSEEVS